MKLTSNPAQCTRAVSLFNTKSLRYAVIGKQKTIQELSLLCKALDLTVSNFYSTKRSAISACKQKDSKPSKQAWFGLNRLTYGINRLQSAFSDEACHHGQARISRLMKYAGLCPKRTIL